MQASTLAGPSRAGGGRGAPAGIAGKGTVATVFGLDVRCDSPLALLHGWIHSVARVNPLTFLLESGRGFISGEPTQVAMAFGIATGLVVVFVTWAVFGLRNAEAAGG